MITLNFGQLNWLAVGAAALAAFFLGAIWYTALFGKLWQRLHGYSDEMVKEMQAKRPAPVFFGSMLVAYVLISLAIALLVPLVGATSAAGGAVLGLILWAGPAVGIRITDHITSTNPPALFVLDSSYQLTFLVIMGAIHGAWR